jgi:hypothetical protein
MKAQLYSAPVAAIGGLAFLVACNANEPVDRTEPTGQTSEALVTISGTNTQDLRSVLLTISELTVVADGRAVPVRIDTAKLDFAQPDEGIDADFQVPVIATTIGVTARFDDYGGYEVRNGEAGVVDARGTSLSFDLPVKSLLTTGKAQLSLDVTRSLIRQRPEQWALAPHFELSY